MIDGLPPPIVVHVDEGSPPAPWTSYVTPAATFRATDMPIVIAVAGGPPPGFLPVEFAGALEVAARTWGLPACSGARFSTVAPRATTGPLDADGRNDVLVHTTDWPAPLTPGAAAHTVIFISGDRILEADIHLNARDFGFTLGKSPPRVDLRSLLTHELGHVLGIGHSAILRATMNAGVPAGIAGRSLEADDVAAVCALYPVPGPKVTCTSCPEGYVCVGHSCERPGERGVLGGPCTATTDARRCEGAGDDAECLLTTVGERCTTLCTGDCGVGLSCVKDADGFGHCLPDGATFVTADAGPDAGGDAGGGDAGGSTPRANGCTCTAGAKRGSTGPWALALALLLLRRAR